MRMMGRRRTMSEKVNADALDWLSGQTLTGYRGLWIVVHDRAILAHAPTLEEALRKARLAPGIVPFVCKVPRGGNLTL
jgi:acyl-ACP thioesterase